MAAPTLSLTADLDKDGTFEEDWSAYLLAVRDVGLSRPSAVDPFSPRRATFVMDNTDSRFSPRNTAGPYYPDLAQGARVRLSVTVDAPAAENNITNPSFETDTASWTAQGANTIAQSEEQARYGRKSLKVTYQNSTALVDYAASGLAAQKLLSCYVYIPTDWDGGTIRIRAFGFTGGTPAADADLNIRDRWQRITVVAGTAFSGTGTIRIQTQSAATAGKFIYVDGVQIDPGSAVIDYLDGDSPGASWSGTAHASTSSRSADPSFNLFTGELRSIRPSRDPQAVGRCEIEATGLIESALRLLLKAGPFVRRNADLVLNRVVDILEGEVAGRILGIQGEATDDGAMRFGGDNWQAFNGGTPSFVDKGEAGDDPISFDTIEGDRVLNIAVTDTLQGAQLDLSLTANQAYRVSFFAKAGGASAHNQEIRWDISGATELGLLTLDQNAWQYASQVFTSWSAATLRIAANDAFTGDILIDGVHVSPVYQSTEDGIAERSFSGTKWAATEIEYLDAYNVTAGHVLRELAASVGGWFYEAGDGTLTFEDYSRRDPAVVSVPVLRLSDAPGDGVGYRIGQYELPAASLANTVRVGSFGDISASPGAAKDNNKQVWELSPASISIAQDELRTFYAKHAVEEVGADPMAAAEGVILRRGGVAKLPSAGWGTDNGVSTPYLVNYGRNSEAVFKGPSSGSATLLHASIWGRVQHRQTSERSFVEQGSGDPVLELEMPAQGLRTQAMTDYATWAEAKYSAGPASIEADLEGLETEQQLYIFGSQIGDPVWLKHKTGPGHLGVEALFYVEGLRLDYDKEAGAPRATLMLEEAPE